MPRQSDIPHHETYKAPNNAKITVFFFLILSLIFIFLGKMFFTVMDERRIPSTDRYVQNKATRGSIISSDGFQIATTQKLYKAIINTKNLDPDKKNLFITLFSIYSGLSTPKIKRKIDSANGHVVLSFSINAKRAKHLRSLAHKLLKLKVFKPYETADNRSIFHGLDILESGETRSYPYNDLLTPVIGYVHKYEEDEYTRVNGIKGVERSYERILEERQDGVKQSERDVNNYLILNKKALVKATIDGPNLLLNIPVSLQRRAEHIASLAKEQYEAKEVMCAIMESTTGRVITLASSNRFDPKAIRKQDYPSLNANFIEYSFEPGSVIKTLVFARLLEHKKIQPFDIINTHNGSFRLGKKLITDEHGFDYLSAENVIVHSSNIGMAQMAQKLGAIELYQGLLDFGLTRKSGLDLPYEKEGYVPSISKLSNNIYKATISYGYGLTTNFIQILKAYNCFNNDGLLVTPRLISKLFQNGKERKFTQVQPQQAVDIVVANRVKKVLIKAVKDGTGAAAHYEGLEIGGKTGTAHIAEKGRYVRKYNSSFFGFANDKKHKYTIGVTVVEPNEHFYFAATSAVPVFKRLTDLLVEFDYLKPGQ